MIALTMNIHSLYQVKIMNVSEIYNFYNRRVISDLYNQHKTLFQSSSGCNLVLLNHFQFLRYL